MDGANWMGQAVLAAQSGFKLQYFWASLSLAGVLLIGALLLKWFERWRKAPTSDVLSAGDQLAHFRELYSRGELSKTEFDQIRARLAGELRQELNLGPTAAKTESAPATGITPDSPTGTVPKDAPTPPPSSEGIKPG